MGRKFLNFEESQRAFAVEFNDVSSSACCNAFDSGVQGMKGNVELFLVEVVDPPPIEIFGI